MIKKTDFNALAESINGPYFNTVISTVNNHVVRVAVMTSAYPWHSHPNSDETFIGIEGIVLIETKAGIQELTPGSSITIPRNMLHRTSPKDARSVNLTVEREDMETEYPEA